MYGSGKSDDPVHTANPLTSNKTGDDTGPTSAFSGYGNTPVPGANRADVDKQYYEGNQSSTTATTGTTSHSTDPSSTSRVPGAFDDDATTTASVKSGVVGQPQKGSALTDSGAVGPSTNKPLPLEPEAAGSGLTGSSLPDRSVGRSVLQAPWTILHGSHADPSTALDTAMIQLLAPQI